MIGDINLINNTTEEWKSIPDYEMYQISNYGRVFSKHRNRLLSICDNGNGYKIVALSKK